MKGKFSNSPNLQQTGGLVYPYMQTLTAKSNRFESKYVGGKPHFDTWPCSSCSEAILSDLNSKSNKREKCDACQKEHRRLVSMVRYWEGKVLQVLNKQKEKSVKQ